MRAIKLTTLKGSSLKPDPNNKEPYSIHNNVAGFPKGLRIFTSGRGRKRAAIVVNNNDIDVTAITQVSHEDAILTEIRYKGAQIFGASLYLPSDRDID